MHMESAFWFLFSLWTIDIIVSVSMLISNIVFKNKLTKELGMLCFLGGGGLILLFIGINFGITFMGIKYSLYYFPYFIVGYWFARIRKTEWFKNNSKLIGVMWAISLLLYVFLISRFNIVLMPDTIISIIIRMIISLLGCYLIFIYIYSLDIIQSDFIIE